MKKILFVIPTMRMGGAEQSLVSLLNAINLDKYDVDLLLFEKAGELLENIPSKVNVMEVDKVTRAMLLEFRFYFKDLIKTGNIGAAFIRLIMVLNGKIQNWIGKKLLFSWEIAKPFVKRLEKPYDVAVGYLEGVTDFYVADKVNAKKKVGWIHTDVSKHQLNRNGEQKYYQRMDVIPVISEECKDNFARNFPNLKAKLCVIENITNENLVIAKSKQRLPEDFVRGSFNIVTVGRLEDVKGIDIAIQATSILNARKHDFVWHVFGDGSKKKELWDLITDLDLCDTFYLDGVTRNPYMYMKAADIVVQPSRTEGKSIVLDEAKILGKPIVVTNYPSVKDQIADGQTGIIVDIEPKALADGIELLMQNKELQHTLSENCRRERKDFSEIKDAIEKLLDED